MEELLGKTIREWAEIKRIMDTLNIATAEELEACLEKSTNYKLHSRNILLDGTLQAITKLSDGVK